MNRGRKPKPQVIIPMDAPAPCKGKPPCPDWLDSIGRKEWERSAELLDTAGVLSLTDMAILAEYAALWSRYVIASQHVIEDGAVMRNVNGFTAKSGWANEADKSLDRLTKLQQELGFTPASRPKVTQVPQVEKPAPNKWNGLIEGTA